MKCPMCGTNIELRIDESDQIRLRQTSTSIIFECFLDHSINRPENQFWDARYNKIDYIGDNKYHFKVFAGQYDDDLFYVEGTAEFYFDPDDIPEIKFHILDEKDVTIKLSNVDEYLEQD